MIMLNEYIEIFISVIYFCYKQKVFEINVVTSDLASHNKAVLDSVFCNKWIHLEFCIHKSSLIL